LREAPERPDALRRWSDPVPRQTASLAVVIPMYREAARIASTLDALDRSTLNRPGVRLVLVDDGSDDDTVDAIFRALPGTTLVDPLVVQCRTNRGKGAAVRTGVLMAEADVIAFVDADLSMDPYVLDLALDLMRTSGADVVVGRRVVDREEQPVIRRACSLVFRRMVATIAPTGAADPQCACKLFTREAALRVFEPLTIEGFAFDVEVLLRARGAGLQVAELPVAWTHQPGSTVNPLVEPLRMVRDVVRARAAIRRGR
jgi:glycosyltransferase involved in cell wall biosynthesis